ncbi:MAG: hypothetical protein ACRC7S_14705 [Cetobacterium sp.]
MKKSRRDLLLERIEKLESYVFDEICTDEVLKKIYIEHAEFLREELSKLNN